MFEVQYHGGDIPRLRYIPFRELKLPEVVRVYEYPGTEMERPVEVALTYGDYRQVRRTVPLYHLRWPGTTNDSVLIPNVVRQSEEWPDVDLDGPNAASSHHSLQALVQANALPETPPHVIAYHLAVNRSRYYGSGPFADGRVRALGEPIRLEPMNNDGRTPYDIGGLPALYVNTVMNETFALDEGYIAAIRYMKWLFETHWGHPLLQGFDTSVREHLLNVAIAAHENFFYLLGDCVWGGGREAAPRHQGALWSRCARYMHWFGRTGSGLVRGFSNLDSDFVQRQWPDLFESVAFFHRAIPMFADEPAEPVEDGSDDEHVGLTDEEFAAVIESDPTEAPVLEDPEAPTGDDILDMRRATGLAASA